MPTFKVRIIANNEAGNWLSWPAKAAAIKAFFAPVCTLDITFEKTALVPVFSPYMESQVYMVDEVWYEQNVSANHTDQAFLIFIVPPTDHPKDVTLLGVETGHAHGPWETTVFSDENSHNYQNGGDMGEEVVVLACHELSHAFYAMLTGVNGGPGDNTHLYFFAGTPEKVLQDFKFETNITVLYQRLIAALQELYLLKKNQ